MWKKPESEPTRHPEPEPAMARPVVEPAAPAKPARERAVIGPSISIRGDVTGEEDLIINGRVEGTVKLARSESTVTVGREGRVKASIHAKIIEVQGRMEGDLRGDEQVVIRRSADVTGDISAPRVSLEDGCKYRGSIEMDAGSTTSRDPAAARVSEFKAAPMTGTEGAARTGVPPSAGPHKLPGS